jgi:hypothetical protein
MKFSKRVVAILGLAPLLAGIATFGSCQTPPPVSQPHIKTVFIILMENKELGADRRQQQRPLHQ